MDWDVEFAGFVTGDDIGACGEGGDEMKVSSGFFHFSAQVFEGLSKGWRAGE